MTDFADLFGRPSAPPGPPTILFVCTGNICRSPLAEKVLRARLDEIGDTTTVSASAGLHAVVGGSMDTLPAEIARGTGATSQHAGAQLTRQHLDSASLVLTMTRAQRAELLEEWPFALKRTFTLVEFVRIASELGSVVPPVNRRSGRSVFDLALDGSNARSTLPPAPDDDIQDPYRQTREVHEAVGRRIIQMIDRLAPVVARST